MITGFLMAYEVIPQVF